MEQAALVDPQTCEHGHKSLLVYGPWDFALVTDQKLTDTEGYEQFQGERRKCKIIISVYVRKNWPENAAGELGGAEELHEVV